MLVGIVLSVGTDAALEAMGVFPAQGQPASSPLLLLATIYRTAYGVAGAYVAARLAPNRPMRHALILGGLGFLVSILGAVVTWNKQLGPHWYPIALILLALRTAWAGGRLRELQLHGPMEGGLDRSNRGSGEVSGD